MIYEVVSSDHRPVNFSLNVNVCTSDPVIINDTFAVSDWSGCTQADINAYTTCITSLLQERHECLPPICCQLNCENESHRNDIDMYLHEIYSCTHDAMARCIPIKRYKSSAYTVPGWDDYVSDKHDVARDAFLSWIAIGRPQI